MKYIKIAVLFGLYFNLFGCINKSDSTKKEVVTIDFDKETDQEKTVKKIFFNLPSPIEITQTILATKSPFNNELPNSATNVTNYSSSSDLALNFGVYGADLCYCRVYDQLQSSISYLAAIRKITVLLQIPEEEGSETINRIEENIENRDSIFQIIAETYAGADGYLKENDRDLTAALIIVGGWIEGMYIAVNLLNTQANQSLLNNIAEQKYSYENLMSVIAEYRDNPAIAELTPYFESLQKVYAQITITHDKSVVVTDQETKVTTIENESQISITPQQLKEITNLIVEIRSKIVS
ncbi:MAG TPA: hypothetical protein DCQ26_15670 [Marinilabiliales bacterium]|nr:MAG: hypothetical protein A2W95_16090 [Bacteroidetes bacterium GWA2_40_14]OFX64081.1 MAG: hypothetical protein A2W84_01685 [Bacteroidetes bacterium GWC2_40_13]OFX73846.1 MAG: hypothetical protein A2W96_19455 [Bacteroidetes bacterium GWD2_40_43]OFX91174.1 MAG: hypothetical protein A2W97_14555 [Bacteroidetes bacterium GWE2_40_63]OFY22850.1 MAG: hypothetical protein A2W88_08650 [Bacteroidetes bacterium GWF2_40_13]OFZ25882.1 MAG: hypothetical protein A2437_16890 [Bacteroidetes bacterium RIFOXYC